MDEHLASTAEPGRSVRNGGNARNGHRMKTVMTEAGPVTLEAPRDRAGTFDPKVVPRHARRTEGLDNLVVSLTAKGLTSGEIVAHVAEVYDMTTSSGPGTASPTSRPPGRRTTQPSCDCGRRLSRRWSLPRLRRRDPQDHMHHQRHREPELPLPQGRRRLRPLPQRPGRPQTALPGHPRPRPHRTRPPALAGAAAGWPPSTPSTSPSTGACQPDGRRPPGPHPPRRSTPRPTRCRTPRS